MEELTYEACQKNLREMCRIHRDTVYFYYNQETDTWYIEANQVLPAQLQGQDTRLFPLMLVTDVIHPDDYYRFETFYQRIKQGMKESIHMEEMSISFRMQTAQSEMETVRVVCFFKLDKEGKISEIAGKFCPLTEQEKVNNSILVQFTSDKNPSFFFKRVRMFMERYPEEQRFAYIQFDVNKFKLINDTYGIEVGDEVLSYISNTLDLLCNDDQLHIRYASDQFLVVMPYSAREEVVDFIHSIDEKICRYKQIRYKLTYGVSISDDRYMSARSYCDEAGIARLSIKGNVLENIAFYDDDLKSTIKTVDAIEQVEEEALANGEFVMYLQPKYDFSSHPVIIGAEALVRWLHPVKGLIPPNDFIPLFEQNGFILKVDEYIWEYACMTLARWIKEGKNPIPISINISRTYLQKVDTVAYISNLVEKYHIPIHLLQLEITETTENEEVAEYIESFKKAGFTMLMDDFGSGYSSLNMLKNTRFDVLKIDRAFLSEFLESNRGKAIVAHIISMSDELGLDTVAEGVETKEQADFLHEKGCTVAQGFYFSKPLPLDEFEKLAFPQEEEKEA